MALSAPEVKRGIVLLGGEELLAAAQRYSCSWR
jgi:hypothetical protein